MHNGPPGKFTDFFLKDEASGSVRFDSANTQGWASRTKVLFLHGALHLYLDEHGATCKLKSEPDSLSTLLDRFGELADVPLFVSEGRWQEKMASIRQSDYLSFAYSRFTNHSGPLVISGHSMDESDMHIVEAINKRPNDKPLAIGVYAKSGTDVASAKALFQYRFPNQDLCFFDSRTHPLTAPNVRIKP